jgi:hypothetical protein
MVSPLLPLGGVVVQSVVVGFVRDKYVGLDAEIGGRIKSSQNTFPPQRPQNPRSAVSDDLYQTSPSAAVSSMLAEGALVMAV